MKTGTRIEILEDCVDLEDQIRSFVGDTGTLMGYVTDPPYDKLIRKVVRVQMDNGRMAKLYESQVATL